MHHPDDGDFSSVEARTLAQMFGKYHPALTKRDITPTRLEEGWRP